MRRRISGGYIEHWTINNVISRRLIKGEPVGDDHVEIDYLVRRSNGDDITEGTMPIDVLDEFVDNPEIDVHQGTDVLFKGPVSDLFNEYFEPNGDDDE